MVRKRTQRFSPGRRGAEITIYYYFSSRLLSKTDEAFKTSSKLWDDENSLEDILVQLHNCPVGLEENLGKTIKCRVAYHHAGLTYDERDIIEGAFRRGILRVLVATSTLSSGIIVCF